MPWIDPYKYKRGAEFEIHTLGSTMRGGAGARKWVSSFTMVMVNSNHTSDSKAGSPPPTYNSRSYGMYQEAVVK